MGVKNTTATATPGDAVNIFSYGAKGNGVSGFDGAALNAAITAASALAAAGSGLADVWCPAGYDYVIDQKIVPKNGVRIRCYGSLMQPDWGGIGAGHSLFEVGGVLDRFEVFGGSWLGTGAEAQNNQLYSGLPGCAHSRMRFKDMYATGFGSGLLYLRNVQHCYVDDCIFPNNNMEAGVATYNVVNFVGDAGAPQTLHDLRCRDCYIDNSLAASVAIVCNTAANVDINALFQNVVSIGNPAATLNISGALDFETSIASNPNIYSGIRIVGGDINFIAGATPNAAINFAQNGLNWQGTVRGTRIQSISAAIRCFSPRMVFQGCDITATHTDLGSAGTYIDNMRAAGQLSGTATLVAGTVTVSAPEVQAGDTIILSRVTAGGTHGDLSVGTIVAGTSFVISSNSATDTSKIYWRISH